MSISRSAKFSSTHSALEKVVWAKPHTLTHKVVAFQTTRQSPSSNSLLSNKPYDYFNLGLHVEDAALTVQNNREMLLSFLPVQDTKKTKIQWLEQVHGNHVVEVIEVSSDAIVADAAISRQKNIALAIMTADCLPILLSDEKGEVIGAIHGGWRPLAADIIANTLDKMQSKPAEIFAWLGPCIGREQFEVGEEVKDTFVNKSAFLERAFKKSNHNSKKYFADLQLIATLQLQHLGVKHISSLNECTYSLPNKYYSYRKNSTTGRMASVICLR